MVPSLYGGLLSQPASLGILQGTRSRMARKGRGPLGGLKCSKPALAEMADAKEDMPCPDVGRCRSSRRLRKVRSTTMAYVVMVDYMVEVVELKAKFSVTRFYILKTTQRERGPQALFRTVLTFYGGAMAASREGVVL